MTQPFDPVPDHPHQLAPGVRLVLADNPSPMTERGTNTWLLGEGAVTVIDPGPDERHHVDAIRAALRPGEHVTRILVTHTHRDHSGAARALSRSVGAPVLAFGRAGDGRSARMAQLAGDLGGGEGMDDSFVPDHTLADGARLEIGHEALIALHTPGHCGNHLCFLWGRRLFSGDMVMGWAPSLVSPPDGDLTDFMASLDRLAALGPVALYPGHGAPVARGQARISELRTHRRAREGAIRAAMAAGAATLNEITAAVYSDTPPALHAAAKRNVLAHLIDLEARGLVRRDGPYDAHTVFVPA